MTDYDSFGVFDQDNTRIMTVLDKLLLILVLLTSIFGGNALIGIIIAGIEGMGGDILSYYDYYIFFNPILWIIVIITHIFKRPKMCDKSAVKPALIFGSIVALQLIPLQVFFLQVSDFEYLPIILLLHTTVSSLLLYKSNTLFWKYTGVVSAFSPTITILIRVVVEFLAS